MKMIQGWLAPLQRWVASKGGPVHAVAAIYVTLAAAYVEVPQFHAWVAHTLATLPAGLQMFCVSVPPLIALYKQPNKPTEENQP